ncbi:hypothetical protein [Algibacter mikhailovii]|nr:hypothetical protein [Algibacter mikhailovii]
MNSLIIFFFLLAFNESNTDNTNNLAQADIIKEIKTLVVNHDNPKLTYLGRIDTI